MRFLQGIIENFMVDLGLSSGYVEMINGQYDWKGGLEVSQYLSQKEFGFFFIYSRELVNVFV